MSKAHKTGAAKTRPLLQRLTWLIRQFMQAAGLTVP